MYGVEMHLRTVVNSAVVLNNHCDRKPPNKGHLSSLPVSHMSPNLLCLQMVPSSSSTYIQTLLLAHTNRTLPWFSVMFIVQSSRSSNAQSTSGTTFLESKYLTVFSIPSPVCRSHGPLNARATSPILPPGSSILLVRTLTKLSMSLLSQRLLKIMELQRILSFWSGIQRITI